MTSDAEATVRTSIITALQNTWGQGTDKIIDALVAEMRESDVHWAYKEYINDRN